MTDEPTKAGAARPVVPPSLHAEGSKARGTVHASQMGKKRAFILIAIHILAFLHILHWKLAGETLSPVEPSEAMYTLRDGLINAGAILMLVATLSVLLVGRFFCGWACHMVFLQDFCAWLLKKVGIRPQPLRSRLLSWVPLGAALVMFGSPIFVRVTRSLDAPEFVPAFIKAEFWETFPGPYITIATFAVAGFAMVYVLGAKGFCTYACPYGGVFALVEKLAPGRIRVTDACKACGHCTAVCTSNVQVANEVHTYGMVVDTGCMKCLDCVSVCPENALYFGMGRPALGAKERRKKKARPPFSFSWGVEVTMVAMFALTLMVFAGLPDSVVTWGTSLHGQTPLLFSLSLAGLTAFTTALVLRGLKADGLTITAHKLKANGSWTTSGRIFCVLTFAWLAFVGLNTFVQINTFSGNYHFEKAETPKYAWVRDKKSVPQNTNKHARDAMRAFQRAESAALFSDLRYPARMAGLSMVLGEYDDAIRFLNRAVKIDPTHAPSHSDLASVLSHTGQFDQALVAVEAAIEHAPENLDYQKQKLAYAQSSNNLERGVEAMEVIVDSTEGQVRRETLFSIVMIRRQLNHREKAKDAIRVFIKEFPNDPRTPQLSGLLNK